MNQVKLLILIIGWSCLPLSAMIKEEALAQVPYEKTVPKFLAEYSRITEPGSMAEEELRKFKKYNLENPDKLIALLRSDLSYSKPLEYLKNLQLFASLLLWQHLELQTLMNYNYLLSYWNYISQKTRNLVKLIDPLYSENDENFEIPYFRINPELLPIIFKDPSAWTGKANEEAVNVIFRLIFSKNKEFVVWGNFLKTLQETWIDEESLANYQRASQQFAEIENKNQSLLKNVHPIINKNVAFLQKVVELRTEHERGIHAILRLEKRTGRTISIKASMNEFFLKLAKLASNYLVVWPHYQNLYEAIRKEMNTVIKEQIAKDKNLARSLLSFHQVVIDDASPVLPKILPASLPEFKNPMGQIKLATYDDEMEKAYEKWKQEGSPEIVKPLVIRKMRRKPKKKQLELVLPQEELVEEKSRESQESSEPAIVMQGADGSYILEGDETDQRITIYNPDHNTIETIYKTSNPNSIKEKLSPNYTDWVKQWFDDPQRAIKDQGYTDPKSKKLTEPRMYWKPIALHAFSQLVDSFIQKWGKKTEVANRRNPGQMDTLITLPGMMIYPDGTQETGVFAYLIDSRTGKWYHRMFEPQGTQKLVQDLLEKGFFSPGMTGYYDVAFPELKRKI